MDLGYGTCIYILSGLFFCSLVIEFSKALEAQKELPFGLGSKSISISRFLKLFISWVGFPLSFTALSFLSKSLKASLGGVINNYSRRSSRVECRIPDMSRVGLCNFLAGCEDGRKRRKEGRKERKEVLRYRLYSRREKKSSPDTYNQSYSMTRYPRIFIS